MQYIKQMIQWWGWMAVLSWSSWCMAFSYVMPTDEGLLQQADGVVKVTIVQHQLISSDAMTTHYDVVVRETLLGPNLPKRLQLELPGAVRTDGTAVVVPGVPSISSGSTLLIVYERTHATQIRPLHLTLGLFGLQSTPKGERYVRFLESSEEQQRSEKRIKYHQPRHPQRFEAWIRQYKKGAADTTEYFESESVGWGDPKFTFQVFVFNHPDFPDGPGRWFEFDQHQALPWTARPEGQANTTFNVFLALNMALAAWTNDAGSHVLNTYAGKAVAQLPCTGQNQAGCFTGHVIWNDADNVIGGTFPTGEGGVLGISRSIVSTPRASYNGIQWYRRASTEIIVQDGAEAFLNLNQGARGIQVLTHEIGHSLGLGHSCGDSASPSCSSDETLNQATMRASAHNDARGAQLGIDDQQALTVIYPEDPNINTGPSVVPNPAHNSTIAMGTGTIGNFVTSNLGFNTTGGRGDATTTLACQGNGAVMVTLGTPQILGVGASSMPVVVRATLTNQPQQGSVQCTATPEEGMAVVYEFFFSVPAGTASCSGTCIFNSGFEAGE